MVYMGIPVVVQIPHIHEVIDFSQEEFSDCSLEELSDSSKDEVSYYFKHEELSAHTRRYQITHMRDQIHDMRISEIPCTRCSQVNHTRGS